MANEHSEVMAIIDAIDAERKHVSTRSLDVSFNELADMYKSEELVIRPEYQRLFRWSNEKQSQFIESILLEMPLPPIFVIENQNAAWELIDGLQRISSYLHFVGLLNSPDSDASIGVGEQLRLEKCDIVPGLERMEFDQLPLTLKIRLKRAYLRVEVVRKETNPRFRYHMFKRLNTGGEPLEEQEVRNCTIRLLGNKFNSFIQKLSNNSSFKTCIEPLTEEKRKRMYDIELVLRFFAFKNWIDCFKHDVGPFMTRYMELVTDQESEDSLPFDYQKEQDVFEKTFSLLEKALETDTCKRWTGERLGGGFSIHHFEAFSLGVSKVIDNLDIDDPAKVNQAREDLLGVKKDQEFMSISKGGGQNSPGLYRRKIEFVSKALETLL